MTFRISDETKAAARARWVEMWGEIDRAGEQMIDDILAAAAPLIAAQVLRNAAEYLDVHGMRAAASMLRSLARDPSDLSAYIARVPDPEDAPENGRKRSPDHCPSCGAYPNAAAEPLVCAHPIHEARSLTEDAP